MTIDDITDYKPGEYGKKRIRPSEWIESHIRRWNSDKSEKAKDRQEKPALLPSICFSRKIGVGALEIADILSEMVGLKVVDREILEHMVKDSSLAMKTVEIFDERYPGKMSELSAMIFNERSFILSDYYKQLAKTVIALANLEPSIFVGRGIHLILPREKVLAVRLICSDDYRIRRLAGIMKTTEAETKKRLEIIDKEQREYFKDVFQKKDAVAYEFDLVINMDHIREPGQAAKIVACAFEQKFGL
jgi:cytidylate kinase